ncbi:MAG: hypothetical protein ACR2L0_05620 [Gaiellaceae bacterium]
MNRDELLRLRRCRLLLLAGAFGILLPILQPSWITVSVAVVGVALLAFAYWRECR